MGSRVPARREAMDLPLEENVVGSGSLFDFRLNSRASLAPDDQTILQLIFRLIP
jgi:hypothetical protein